MFFKRMIDFIGSLIGLVLLSPLLILIILSIKVNSPGPALFYQKRLGRNGKIFEIIKFRTMIINAENIGDGLSVRDHKDPRITSIGNFLRKTSLDELPQLINILKGDMSIVGPRPPVVYYPYPGYDSYPAWAKTRFSVKPGLTGLAQVTARNSVSWDDRIRIDLKYVEKQSILLDFKIILMTVKKVFKSEGIYMNNGEKRN